MMPIESNYLHIISCMICSFPPRLLQRTYRCSKQTTNNFTKTTKGFVISLSYLTTAPPAKMIIPEDPNTSQQLNALNRHFSSSSFVSQPGFSDKDRTLFTRLQGAPNSTAYPHLFRWYTHAKFHSKSSSVNSQNPMVVTKNLPPWHEPKTDVPILKMYNSLTRRKDEFIPNNGKNVMWYNCGPTVYDASHMGHARSYITFDILRRVMTDYFGYNLFYVMNITDIDDKIIFRARTKYLLDNYRSEMSSRDRSEVLSEVNQSVEIFKTKMQKLPEDDPKRKMMEKALLALEPILSKPEADLNELLTLASMPMEGFLDTKSGAGVTDHSIFAALTQHWETEFHNDLKSLNVLPPDVLTRVTEYVPEIIVYVQQIIKNGYGYESNGSVYFDSAKWRSQKGYLAKIKPESVGDLDAMAEAEGKLTDMNTKEKKNQVDFALWKASKPGEPFWDSPWGKGRPGWHIECSAMADDICKGKLDIHSGGEDLMFPHHDNEILQAESYSNCNQWVNYFLHAGHLTIEGCKMSKSLKNFISIKDALKKNTGRQLRLHFLAHSWHGGLDYSTSGMSEAVNLEKYFNDFFLLVKYHQSSLGEGIHSFSKLHDNELTLYNKLQECQCSVHKALCDSFDTPSVMKLLKSVVSDAYSYMHLEKEPNVRLLVQVAVYVTKMLAIFGVVDSKDKIGFGSSGDGSTESGDVVLPFVKALSEFRDEVRTVARELKAREVLESCDRLRDDVLPELGVRLEDREIGDAAVFKIDDKDTLLREKQQRQEEKEKKEKEKAEKAAAREKAEREKLEKGKLSPLEMFRNEQYSEWDDTGLPTTDAKGVKITNSQLKKLKKLQANQEKLHKQYLQHISDLEI